MRNIILAVSATLLILFGSNASAEIKIKSLSKKKWTTVESENFKIVTDMKAKKARLTAEQLERYRAFCEFFLNIEPQKSTDSKLVLYMTDSRRTWKAMGLGDDLVSVYVYRPGAPGQMFVDVNGFFGTSFKKPNSGRSVVLNAVTKDLLRVAGIGENYPLWFRTGFAYYLATYTESSNYLVLGNLDAYENRFSAIFNATGKLSSFDTNALFARKTPIGRFPGMSNKQWLRETNRNYMHSFLTLHYLYADNARQRQLTDYLKLVVSGDAQDDAFLSAFSKPYVEFDKDLWGYVSNSKLYARTMDREKVLKLLELPESYTVSSIEDAEFFRIFAQGIQELGESSMPAQDKQAFLKVYNQRYNKNRLSTPQL